WGPMHWGHAVSKDLLHWQHLPIALYPDSLGYIFSGSVVVDTKNSSGFKDGAEDPLVAIFTYHNMAGEKAGTRNFQTQGLAYSTDKGRHWTKYSGNPVIKNPGNKDFRDPKVFWHEPTRHWIMSLAVGDRIQFYHSTDLKDWSLTSDFGIKEGSHGGVWECPDLFPLAVEGSTETKWVLIVSIGNGAPNGGSGTQYFVGDFDGRNFVNAQPANTERWIDYGTDNYAGVTWSNVPDDKRLFLGWMSNWQYARDVPTEKWRSAMTLPRQLRLVKTGDKYFVSSVPVTGLKNTRVNQKPHAITTTIFTAGPLAEIILEVDGQKTTSPSFAIELLNDKSEKITVGYNDSNHTYFIDRTQAGSTSFSPVFAARETAPRLTDAKIMKLHIFTDRSSIEVFADDGLTCLTAIYFPSADFTKMRLVKDTGEIVFLKNEWYGLKSVW
ncbi:MAG: glycoside hydrolase family 32 protein, partial [Ferruginibacter sp.]